MSRVREIRLSQLEEVKLKSIREQLFKRERELINFEELLEEKRIVQLIKLNDEILESAEGVKESDIVVNKLIRHLRGLNLTYSFNEEHLQSRLNRLVDD